MELFYKRRRIYHRLDDVHKGFVVHVDRGKRRFFLGFLSVDEFEKWYILLSPGERTMNEVVMSDTRKLIIDIDSPDDVAKLSMYDFKRHLISRIRSIFAMLEIGNPDIIIYNMSDLSNGILSYHAIVTNFIFSAKTCIGLCMIISSGQVWDKCVDTGIYKTVQCIRMEHSTKFGEQRWKRRIDMKHAPFRYSLVSDTKGAVRSYVVCNVKYEYKRQYQHIVYNSLNYDYTQFRIGHPKNGYIPLYRVKPGFCVQCNRTHDRDNATIRYNYDYNRKQYTFFFMCWRKAT